MEEYEKYYQKGGTYELPIEIFNDIISELQQYKQQIDELKEYVNSRHFEANFQSDNKKHILQILK